MRLASYSLSREASLICLTLLLARLSYFSIQLIRPMFRTAIKVSWRTNVMWLHNWLILVVGVMLSGDHSLVHLTEYAIVSKHTSWRYLTYFVMLNDDYFVAMDDKDWQCLSLYCSINDLISDLQRVLPAGDTTDELVEDFTIISEGVLGLQIVTKYLPNEGV